MSADSRERDPDDGYRQALGEGLLPIREVARLTGVNPVTLRAWERRYGLIAPQRTAKGHRLYSREHVEQIKAILAWLDRGVAVSQVKGLLRSADRAGAEQGSQWDDRSQQMLEAVGQLSERCLDDCFNRELALYPPQTLCRQLLLPLLDTLEARWRGRFGGDLERVFFHSWLRSKLGARLYHNNRQHSGEPLLLINMSELAMAPGLWLTAWLASSADCPVEVFDWPVPAAELPLALERIRPRALLLYASQSLTGAQLPRLLTGHQRPCLLIGPAVLIHHDELEQLCGEHAELSLAEDPLAALRALADLKLLGTPANR